MRLLERIAQPTPPHPMLLLIAESGVRGPNIGIHGRQGGLAGDQEAWLMGVRGHSREIPAI